ncbi:MAG: RsmD family RNA methyltransferase [Sphingobacteriales bacterium]
MRIIGGEWGGRRINPPGNMPFTRPTTDIAKEGLFNVIQNNLDITACDTLDLFGGTGAISYELASRGAAALTIVEKDPAMFDFIKKTSSSLRMERAKLIKMDVFRFLETCSEQYDLIFAGPPYALNTIDDLPRVIFDKGLLKDGGWFILEHTPRNDYKTFTGYRTERKYGTTIFTIFVNQPA